jgi:hypothetical protein
MTMIAGNPFLMALNRGDEGDFKPKHILIAFEQQLAHRGSFGPDTIFLPPPSLEEAKQIVEESIKALSAILEARQLNPDEIVEDKDAREELVAFVREHLKKFYY